MKHRINRIREEMDKESLQALIIDSTVNYFYLTGFTGTNATVLFIPGNNYFITDFRYIEQAKNQVAGYDIIEISSKLEDKLFEILKDENIEKLGFDSANVSYQKVEKYREKFTGIELVPTSGIVERLRIIKEKDEVEKIRRAIHITEQAFDYILDIIKPGVKEREIALELEYFMKKAGGEKNAFDFIVASGKRAAMPHGVASDKEINKGDFVTMDFGVVYDGYCSDLTRTVVVGKATDRQHEIYDIVLKAHLEVIKKIKPGLTGREADAIARDIINDAGFKDNFGHGLGHGLGIEVHEKPGVSYSSDDLLKAGMVITDEPGIYIPDWGGVRIEDDLYLVEDGCERLNTATRNLIEL